MASTWLDLRRGSRGPAVLCPIQFDEHNQPRPVIKEILAELGPVTDPWKIAAWFYFPNGWIVEEGGAGPITPKNALDNRLGVLESARRFRGTAVA